jgi:hypothetical protein
VVRFATRDGSARAGEQYMATSATVEFAPLEVEKSVTVKLRDDGVFRGSTEFFITLDDPAGKAPAGLPAKIEIGDSILGFARSDSSGNGGVTFSLVGVPPGKEVIIESSNDMKSWEIWGQYFDPPPLLPISLISGCCDIPARFFRSSVR